MLIVEICLTNNIPDFLRDVVDFIVWKLNYSPLPV